MKVAPIIIFLFEDADGFGASLFDALLPNPSSRLQRSEDDFEFPLRSCGIEDLKASGKAAHYIDEKGLYQVSLVLLQYYEPPILACALNVVLTSIKTVESLRKPTIILPCIVSSSKRKLVARSSALGIKKFPLYGMQVNPGPRADIANLLAARVRKPASSLEILHEQAACFLQLVRVLRIPTFVLIGQSGQRISSVTSKEELEVFYEIGELLANTAGLCFLRDRIAWKPTSQSGETEEPWRALYG